MQVPASFPRYREIVQEDAPAILAVRMGTDENAPSGEQLAALGITEESLRARLAASCRGWICEVDGRVVGFALGDSSSGELWSIAVLPSHVRRGIGSALLAMVESWLSSQGCGSYWLTTNSNTGLRAYSFFRHRGWADEGVRDGLRYLRKTPAGAKPVQSSVPEPSAIPTPAPALQPQVRKHSSLGVASFVLSIVFGVLIFVTFAFAGLVYARNGGNVSSGSMSQTLIGLAIIAFGLMDVIALGLGIGGFFQKGRRQVLTIIGVALSAVTLFSVVCLIVIGLLSKV